MVRKRQALGRTANCSGLGSASPRAEFEAGEVFEVLGAVTFEVVVGHLWFEEPVKASCPQPGIELLVAGPEPSV